MTPDRRLAPEVAAALGQGRVSEQAIRTSTQTELTGAPLMDLVARMRHAERVEIVGVLPRALGEALLSAEQFGSGEIPVVVPASDDTSPAPARRRERIYLTPRRERVAAYRHEHVMGRVVQRWSCGWFCFRNWTAHRAHETDRAEIRLVDDLFLDCVVVCHSPGHDPAVWVLTLLPQPDRPAPPEAIQREELVITQVQAASIHGVLARITDLHTTGRPLADRGLICTNAAPPQVAADDVPALPEEFVPVIIDFHSVWRTPSRPGTILPVCIVALNATTSRGPGLLLLHRTIFNSRNDFDTLSLLSERVREEDFAQAAAKTLPDLPPGSDALEAWWMLLGKPHRMDVPRAAFVAAGQREVFLSCGLDLEADRFTYRGSHLVEHEGADRALGFVGFRVELRRGDDVDELARAQRWNPDLVFVLADELYQPRSADPASPRDQRPLNRLLSKRPDWVRSTLIGRSDQERTDTDA